MGKKNLNFSATIDSNILIFLYTLKHMVPVTFLYCLHLSSSFVINMEFHIIDFTQTFNIEMQIAEKLDRKKRQTPSYLM